MAVRPRVSVLTPVRAKTQLDVAWLQECIGSVQGQTFQDWEHIIVNDHSPRSAGILEQREWPNVRWLQAEHNGVSAARNQAAEAARGELLLPLDADDQLARTALAQFLKAWNHRDDGAGIIYSDVMMFGQDYARVYLAQEYNFKKLLEATIMVVGSLHRKADWERVGGWRLDMTQGLEDWEYWIALGEMGVCGQRIPEPLYWYRRHPRGRLQWLKANKEKWDAAYLAMRQLHIESYNGRYPMGCCGGGRTPRGARRPLHGGVPRPQPAGRGQVMAAGLVQMVYVGAKQGSFQLMAVDTRHRYNVPGAGGLVEEAETGKQGVARQDVAWFRSVNQGRDFKVVEEPARVKPVAAPPPPKPVAPAPEESEAWDPEPMETDIVEVKDEEEQFHAGLANMTVREICKAGWDPVAAEWLIEEERAGKNRKTVLRFFERLA